MDLAKRMLEKYGWSEGQGLGKNSNGITTAIKPKVKLNNFGLGHDRGKEFTYRWWEDAFNEAARNVNVEESEDGPKMKTIDKDALEISAVKRSKINRDKAKYGTFLKRETLTKKGVEVDPVLETAPQKLPVMLPATLSDEQLFQACGGLTAHKGARHGLTLSGKLKRVREQEEALLKAFQQNKSKKSKSTTDKKLKEESEVPDNKLSKKSKKEKISESVSDELIELSEKEIKKEKKRKRRSESQYLEESKLNAGEVYENRKSKKNKKKKRHEIDQSFAEDTVETIDNPDVDETSEKVRRKKKKKYKEGCMKDEEEVCQNDELPLDKKPKKRKTEETER